MKNRCKDCGVKLSKKKYIDMTGYFPCLIKIPCRKCGKKKYITMYITTKWFETNTAGMTRSKITNVVRN